MVTVMEIPAAQAADQMLADAAGTTGRDPVRFRRMPIIVLGRPDVHELLTPVRLRDGREGEIRGRTMPVLGLPATYDVLVGGEIVHPVLHGDVVAIGLPDAARLAEARMRAHDGLELAA